MAAQRQRKEFDREAERARVRQATETLTTLAETIADPTTGDETFEAFLEFSSKLWRYSAGNVTWLWFQWEERRQANPALPELSTVATFKRWQALGRQVKKGEKAMEILMPRQGRAKVEKEEAEAEAEVRTFTYFVCKRCVFDISQTEGDEIPNFKRDLGEGAADVIPALIDFATQQGIEVQFGPVPDFTNGYSTGGTIRISDSIPPGIQVQTLVHELAHELLHQGKDHDLPGSVKEGEAEAVSVVVMKHLGYDITSNGAAYIRSHNATPDMIRTSMNRIVATARILMEELSGSKEGEGEE